MSLCTVEDTHSGRCWTDVHTKKKIKSTRPTEPSEAQRAEYAFGFVFVNSRFSILHKPLGKERQGREKLALVKIDI